MCFLLLKECTRQSVESGGGGVGRGVFRRSTNILLITFLSWLKRVHTTADDYFYGVAVAHGSYGFPRLRGAFSTEAFCGGFTQVYQDQW